MRVLTRCRLALFLPFLTLTLSGCGDPGIGAVPVSGKVTVDGAPQPDVLVMFSPDSAGGEAASGKTDAEGVFHLTTQEYRDGAIPGRYKVVVTKYETEGGPAPGQPQAQISADDTAALNEMYKKVYSGDPRKMKAPKSTNAIDAKYSQPATSGIVAEVLKGEPNTAFTWDVKGN